ncbi:Crp/Fnr family transcriptional regulator [Treponema zioleckii]|uniref:Crp/Fnr family transcriptional regulator n=1 Tax=Treponema zioleckii TaxID=331680 RepID=UPI00168A6DF3|nr:Crp/Fnr family transcriptional regulator [Treponema zioleckii]
MTEKIQFESIFAFWKDLTPVQRSALEQTARKETFARGNVIHRSDGTCRGVMAVLSGSLRVYCVSDEGREVTLYRVEAGEICILSASCLMDSLVFDVLIEALSETEVCLLPSAVLHKIEEQNPLVSLFIYKNATEKFSEVLWTIQQLLFMKIDQRIAQTLHDEMLRQGTDTLCVTHEEIAKQIGSVREVVTKTLKYLSEEGVVLLSRGKIKITDKEKLRSFI